MEQAVFSTSGLGSPDPVETGMYPRPGHWDEQPKGLTCYGSCAAGGLAECCRG